MSKSSNSSQILRSSAEVLAAAVLQRCPNAFAIQGGETILGFAYDFHFPDTFSESLIPYIEETLANLIQRDLPIEHREMIPSNAATFFKHKKRIYPATFAKNVPGPLVEIFEMEGFVDLCEGPFVESTGELEPIKIVRVSERSPLPFRGSEKKVIRLEGMLKKFVKHRKDLLEREKESEKLFLTHQMRLKDFQEINRTFWLAEGLAIKKNLTDFWFEKHQENKFEIIESQGSNLEFAHEELLILKKIDLEKSPWKVAEIAQKNLGEGIDPWMGLYKAKDYFYDVGHCFCLKKDLFNEIISSLQFLKETIKIFGLEWTFEIYSSKNTDLNEILKEASEKCQISGEELKGKTTKLQWKVTDSLNRKWDGAFLEIKQRKEGYLIRHSLFGELERFIFFLLEKTDFRKRMKDIAKKRNFE